MQMLGEIATIHDFPFWKDWSFWVLVTYSILAVVGLAASPFLVKWGTLPPYKVDFSIYPQAEAALQNLVDVAERCHQRKTQPLWILQAYATVTSVVASTLLAALAVPAKDARLGGALMATIAIHLAITQGLHKAFRIEHNLSTAKAIRAELVAFYSRLSHIPEDYLSDNAKEFFTRVENLETKYSELDSVRIPTIPTN
jgi:hypothetical protein